MSTLIAILGVILVSALYGIILYYVFKYGAQGVLEWYWKQVRVLVERIRYGQSKPKHIAVDPEIERIVFERSVAKLEHEALPARSVEEWGHPAGCDICYPPAELDVSRVIKAAGVNTRQAFCSHESTWEDRTLGGDVTVHCSWCGKILEEYNVRY